MELSSTPAVWDHPHRNAPAKAPLDAHSLGALVAPGGLFIMDNPHIVELAPKCAYASAFAGAEVYRALGAYDNTTYLSDVQSNTHCGERPKWSSPLRYNIQKFLTKTGNTPGLIEAATSQTATLATWRDWETPTLP